MPILSKPVEQPREGRARRTETPPELVEQPREGRARRTETPPKPVE
ncbi:hypothetical protein FB554_2617 [Barrientosiimonas humi]|uniref:Uncharacterized protein n=1 Tax=Barrientosiimonas humi TaxID=999931 RepID=A0A542XF47_9MICO|nr:hypothetical protein [Barrientosiimonas humi]TQL34447.1 hypothetical protein FB554_2617 [Barrientosiimonas humi]CAG7574436.1 hypothetical protein BH39T_PBIAJDOK_03087 [Barrientosiimonas humi]